MNSIANQISRISDRNIYEIRPTKRRIVSTATARCLSWQPRRTHTKSIFYNIKRTYQPLAAARNRWKRPCLTLVPSAFSVHIQRVFSAVHYINTHRVIREIIRHSDGETVYFGYGTKYKRPMMERVNQSFRYVQIVVGPQCIYDIKRNIASLVRRTRAKKENINESTTQFRASNSAAGF